VSSQAALWVLYRRQGLSWSEASRAAGFSSGPSPKARRLWEAAKKVRIIRGASLDTLRERIAAKELELQQMRDIAEVVEILMLYRAD